uniref:Uncharacterized protein n=1 Tax=Nonomuraea gerenzanensis TaxID=93944 RepID=A0A1M4ECX6_9ACTN|nr:hypothetical protein BN4615_P6176 [Nonomuraea gerenzanensis]
MYRQLSRWAAAQLIRKIGPGVYTAEPGSTALLPTAQEPYYLALGQGPQVALGDAHGGLAAALGLRIGRDTGADGQPVVVADLDDLPVAHRDAGDVVGGDGALVVGQRIGRRATELPQRRIQAGRDRRQRLVQHRDDHPEPRPGQPRAPQPRPAARDLRAVSPIPLHPQPRLGNPGTKHPAMARLIGGLGRGHRAPRGAVSAAEPHRRDLLVHPISTDPPTRALDQLLDLRHELVDHLRPGLPPGRVAALAAQQHVTLHGVVVDAGQLSRGAVTTRKVIRFQNLHDLLFRLHTGQANRPVITRHQKDHVSVSGEILCPPAGRRSDRWQGAFHVRRQFIERT